MASVEVTVRLFAILRERAGASKVTVDLPEGARVRTRSTRSAAWPTGCRS